MGEAISKEMPKAIVYCRAQLCFLGGMEIVLVAVAPLPRLGVSGMQLYRVLPL